MIQLFLSEPTWNNDDEGVTDECLDERIVSLLKELELVIWSLMTSGGRSEARLWLCKTISGLTSISHRHQREVFVNLLKSKPRKRQLASQLWKLMFEKQPRKAGRILAKKCYLLEDFFRGNPSRILQWFSNFSGTGDQEHQKGAKALSQFAFVNRDICWEELEWKGKHGQSPAMVATKPHYFLDLDVQRTVENFLEYVPEFWSSREFAESLKDGEILFMDPKYFADILVDLMYKDDMEEAWEAIDEFLFEEAFSFLCHHLLIVLDEQDLYTFIKLIRKFLDPRLASMDIVDSSCWLEILLVEDSCWDSIDYLLLLNALVSQGRQLLKLVQEEGGQEDKETINNVIAQLTESSSSANNLAPIVKECAKRKTLEPVKWLGLYSWAVYYRLTEEFWTPESWESLFAGNGISFRKSDKYVILDHDEYSDGADSDERSSTGRKFKKKGKYRKRRRKDSDKSYHNDGLEFDLASNRLHLRSKAGNWLLSTDGYSTTWNSVDLPEHLSRHCFIIWMKWAFTKRGNVT